MFSATSIPRRSRGCERAGPMDFTGVIIDHAYRVLMKRSDTPDAEVYCGEPLASGPPVAIAFLREQIADDDEDVKETFLKDGRALCRFTHPNVIEMFVCGIYQGRPYAITALPVGEPLHAEIGALKQDPQRAVRAIA